MPDVGEISNDLLKYATKPLVTWPVNRLAAVANMKKDFPRRRSVTMLDGCEANEIGRSVGRGPLSDMATLSRYCAL